VLINFFILAFIIFSMVKFINTLRQSAAPATTEETKAPTPENIVLLRDIRNALCASSTPPKAPSASSTTRAKRTPSKKPTK
jgi:hypothetical protein